MKNKLKNKIIVRMISLSFIIYHLSFSVACNEWLDVLPNNEQVTDEYWKSKEDVEAVIASGYYYMRQCVPTIIKWGELRGGVLYTQNNNDARLQDFNILPSNSLCDWTTLYKVIGVANSVIMYAPQVNDDTYYESMLNSHLAEAYFMRDYCFLLLVKNFKEAPMVLTAYVNDNASFDLAKSSEEEIIARIKEDIKTVLATGAAKGTYEDEWATKGRVTKWALYALMADACLWSEDYDQCIEYCDMILNASDTFRPAFMSNAIDWYTMFYPGNSNESILELNWDYNSEIIENNFTTLFPLDQTIGSLNFTDEATALAREETQILKDKGFVESERMGRMWLSTYVCVRAEKENGRTKYIPLDWSLPSSKYSIWKYYGNEIQDVDGGIRAHYDANFIIYRVSEIMLMKAQALTMKGEAYWPEAVTLINRIRNRASLPNMDVAVSELDELTLLEEILKQKEMEFMAEAKRWYDLLWFGRIGHYKYKTQFISKVIEGNQTTNPQWILSVLQDPNAWYMPIPQADIEHNKLLEQNPYYGTTK